MFCWEQSLPFFEFPFEWKFRWNLIVQVVCGYQHRRKLIQTNTEFNELWTFLTNDTEMSLSVSIGMLTFNEISIVVVVNDNTVRIQLKLGQCRAAHLPQQFTLLFFFLHKHIYTHSNFQYVHCLILARIFVLFAQLFYVLFNSWFRVVS